MASKILAAAETYYASNKSMPGYKITGYREDWIKQI
jgi:hypothetical protein